MLVPSAALEGCVFLRPEIKLGICFEEKETKAKQVGIECEWLAYIFETKKGIKIKRNGRLL